MYEQALDKGIAKECARALLPLTTVTKLYMNGTIRSWIHYLQLRLQDDTQMEHRKVAREIREIFTKQLPVVGATALE
jgi:thymidylate synthase (FAD)